MIDGDAMDGDAVAKPALVGALRSLRGDLESEDARQRLAAVLQLITACQESKAHQQAAGAFLREPVSRVNAFGPKKLLEIVLADLKSADRTVRCTAARLVCHLAYENLVNQESIMQHSTGFSVGWLYVFAIPQPCTEPTKSLEPVSRRANSQRDLRAFIQSAVMDQYAEVYKRVSEYYANGCRSFLPLCWRYADAKTGSDEVMYDGVPDPADNLVGFYLVPRQTQFMEPDEFYHDEIMRSMNASDRQQLQDLKSAFKKVALVAQRGCESSDPTVSTAALTHYCSTLVRDEVRPLEWFLNVKGVHTTTLGSYFDSADGTRIVTWDEVFVFASIQLNATKIVELHGANAIETLRSIFLRCSLMKDENLTSRSNVWAPVFVSIVQQEKDLDPNLRRQIRALERGVIPTLSKDEEDWRTALRFKLEQLNPISWAVLLAQWRTAAEFERRLGEEQNNTPLQHTTSVCSVNNLRKSIVELVQPGSYKNLDDLRRELPMVYRSASQYNVRNPSAKALPVFHEEESLEDEATATTLCGHSGQDFAKEKRREDANSLEYNLALFQRMQQSMTELDKLSVQKLEEKKREKARVWDIVELNKKRTEEEEDRKKMQIDEKHRSLNAKLADLEQRKLMLRAKANERKQRKLEQVARKRQQLDAEMEAKKNEMDEKLLRERQNRVQQLSKRPATERGLRQETPLHHPMPPRPDTSRKPQSARLPASSSLAALATPKQPIRAVAETPEPPAPEILRQRALLYGQVVSKIYRADATNRSPPSQASPEVVQPHHLTRSFSVYSTGSFNVKAPVVKVAPPISRSRRPSSYRRGIYSKHYKATTAPPESDEERSGDDGDEESTGLSRSQRSGGSPTTSRSSRKSPRKALPEDHPNACSTLVMRNAALTVSERICIPEVPAPLVEAPSVPPYVIAAQYEALDDQHKRNFRQRFNLKCVSHRLSYAVLKQYTKIVRRDMAWQAFHDKVVSNSQKLKYADFVAVAQSLGIAMSDKKLLSVARQLDEKKSGTVEWKAFYTWWSMQYDDNIR